MSEVGAAPQQNSVILCEVGKEYAAIAVDSTVLVFSEKEGRLTGRLEGVEHVTAIAVDDAAGTVLVALQSKQLAVVSPSGEVITSHKSPKAIVAMRAVVMEVPVEGGATASVPVVLTADRIGDVSAVDMATGRSRLLGGHTATVLLDLDVSKDGSLVLSADRDHKIRVSRLPYGTVIQAFCLGHTDAVRCVRTLSGDLAGYALSGGADGSLRMWRLEDGANVATLAGLGASPAAGAGASGSAAPAALPECVFSIEEVPGKAGHAAVAVTGTTHVFEVLAAVGADGAASLTQLGVEDLGARPMVLAQGASAVVAVTEHAHVATVRAEGAPAWFDAANEALKPFAAVPQGFIPRQPARTPQSQDSAYPPRK